MQTDEASDYGAWWVYLLVFFLLSAGIIASSYIYYRSYERNSRAEVETRLSAIADLKVDALAQYRKERMEDAFLLFQNAPISALVRLILKTPPSPYAQLQLQVWLDKYQANTQFDEARLLDAQGLTLLTSPAGQPAVSSFVVKAGSDALRSGQVIFQDFYRSDKDQQIYLGVLVPILDEQDANRPLGVFFLRINPATYLYPFIQTWPAPNKTAETLLIRREGNEAVFLNDLRFRKNAALSLRAPLDRIIMPAVQAALGREGMMEGLDYRVMPVVAILRTIPDSPWSLVTRMDRAEIYEPLGERLWIALCLVVLLLFSMGAFLGLIWRWKQIRFYENKAKMSLQTKLLATVVRNSNDAIVIQDCEGNITAWNHGAEMMFGYSEQEALLMNINRLIPSHKTAEENNITRQILSGEIVPSYETQRLTKGGLVLNVWRTVTQLVDGEGKVIGIASNKSDITALKRAEEVLVEKNAELIRFNYTVSHDLKSPLVTIKSFLGQLDKDMANANAERIAEDLRFINSAADKMKTLLAELLNLSRIDHKKNPFEETPLHDILHEALLLTAGRIDKLGMRVQVADEPVLLYGDRVRLVEVFQNLIDNAAKFMGNQSEPLVEIGASVKNNEVQISVSDNGMGIDSKYTDKIFGLFEKLNPEMDGTGMGLALVKRIVEVHGGRIWVESEGLGKGVCFRLSLPCKLVQG
jgi:PAS domain S-box-containing protein